MSNDNAKDKKMMLKEMREAIKIEKYAFAIEKGLNLLNDDPTNYMCHLLLGAAYQSVSKAEAAKHLRKAVEFCAPTPPTVALQGLANCAPIEELPKIYEQLIQLLPDKRADYYDKLYKVADNRNVTDICFNIFRKELTKEPKPDEKLKTLIYNCMAKLWISNDLAVSQDDEELFQTVLESVINSEQADTILLLSAYKRYLKLLYKQKDFTNCLKYADEVIERFPDDIYAYEWICKIYCEQHTKELTNFLGELKQPMQHYATHLLQLNPNSGLALLVKAFDLYASAQYVAAHELLKKVQSVQPNYGVAVELLANVLMKMDAFEMALPLWQQLEQVSTLDYAICLSHCAENEQLLKAVGILEEIEQQSEDGQHALARCYYKLQDKKKLQALKLNTLMHAEFLMTPTEAINTLLACENVESFDTLLVLGKLYRKQQNYTEALNCMLKATRLQPYRACCFYHLGCIYYAIGDVVRARKCLEKCINMNPACIDAVYNLSAIYQELEEEDLNMALLLNALVHIKVESSHKIQYKLGLHYLKANKWDDAIYAFRAAIKADIGCIIFWESLGDAYAARGSYHSAIRVFQKTLEMDAANVYAKLQLALLKTTLRMYSEAIEDFDTLLMQHPNYLPGLKGAAEAHLGLAQNLKLDHLYGRCKVHMQLALNQLQNAFLMQHKHDAVWLWRLTANIFMEVALLPPSLANLEVSGKLAHAESTDELVILQRNDLLQLAKRFYSYAVKLKPNTFLWYELALCYYRCAEFMPDKAQTQLEMAEKACKIAIEAQKERWQNWNLLGVIQMHKLIDKPELAQHCFIQALNIERKSYTGWTNLGVLYLRLKEIKLANQAFQRAQQSSPVYGNAWIGQAMIAEAIAEDEEALDLFRHCLQFKYHAESALGYAHWICRELSNVGNSISKQYKRAIESNCADVVALDEINWYTINEETESCVAGLSFHAFLSIRQKLYQPAVKSYLLAVKKAIPGAERDKMLTNLGYLYLKLNEPNEAINIFHMVAEATLKAIIGLALAYFHAKQYQESYMVFSTVLKSLEGTDDHKAACILVAMSAMLYASQGEADTKSMLDQCLPLEGAPIQATYSAFALGILHNDKELTTRMLQALQRQQNCKEYCADIAYLISQYHLRNQRALVGLKYIVSRVHLFPQCTELRRVLANYLNANFEGHTHYAEATSQIALSAIDLSHRNMKTKNDCIEDAKCLIIASRALKTINKVRSSKLTQRAVHLNPQNLNAWSNLLIN